MTDNMRAFLLVGGLGTRLRPIVQDKPKAMALISGRPFLEYQIALLKACGVHEFVLCVGHLRDDIIAHFGSGLKWEIDIEYAVEEYPLGTAGALLNAARYVTGTFILMNGDTYLDVNYRDLIRDQVTRQDRSTIGTLGIIQVQDCSRFGTIEWAPETGQVTAFLEKEAGEPAIGWINAGVYVLEPSVLDHIPRGRPSSLEREVFPALQRRGLLRASPLNGTFVDIGTPEGYATLGELLAQAHRNSTQHTASQASEG